MRKEHLDRLLAEMLTIIESDSYNLTRDEQDSLSIKVYQLSADIDNTYKSKRHVV